MSNFISSSRLAQSVLMFSALALSLTTVGCVADVDGGDPSEEDGQGLNGDADECSAFEGDGCTPGETLPCSGANNPSFGLNQVCELVPDEPCTTQWDVMSCNTPLVLSFDNGPVTLIADSSHGFDVNGRQSLVTDWPTARTPWLAIDRDGDGRITDGSELFGSMSSLTSGRRAANGFIALRELDANGDGKITPQDPGWKELLVWGDSDGNRDSLPGELASLSTWRLLSIDLDYISDPRCDARGNCEVERASFRYLDASFVERTGTVIDVHLNAQR